MAGVANFQRRRVDGTRILAGFLACGYYATHWQAEARSSLDQHDPTQALFAAVRAVSYVDAPATRATLEDAWQALQQTSSTPTHKAS